MNKLGESMPNLGNTHNTFWHEDQVVISFYFEEALTDSNKAAIYEKLNQYSLSLNKFLVSHGFTLDFFSREIRRNGEASIPQSHYVGVDSSTPGVYLFGLQSKIKPSFPVPVKGKEIQTSVISFFQLSKTDGEQPSMTRTVSEGMTTIQKSKAFDDDEQDDHDSDDHRHKQRRSKTGPVPQVVNLINDNLEKLNSAEGDGYGIQILAATPHMYCGATQGDRVTQGCPAVPPIPVPVEASCPSSPGLWPIKLSLGDKTSTIGTGKGVTVFILDTLPNRQEISRAAIAAGNNNKLLLDVDKYVAFNYQFDGLVDAVDVSGLGEISVAKDIYGRHTNFSMPDHGLFIAGIVRSAASDVSIECIRVLNDYCVGDTNVLLRSLQYIHNRMSAINPDTNQQGDLFNRPVVINMSLVIPTDDEAKLLRVKTKGGGKKNILRTDLLAAIQSLVELGAVFAASAGNEGDNPMNPSGKIPDALYPAAFANDKVKGIISVGAANSAHKAAKYSCFPGPLGIATYGGEIPKAIPSKPPKHPPTPGCITKPKAIDALVGIYSSNTYPSLSIDDCDPTYFAPNNSAWTYWVGTSFATPIISAVLACILEKSRPGYNVPLLVFITNAVLGASGSITWTNLASKKISPPNFVGRMIQVTQCKPAVQSDNVQEGQKVKKQNKVEV
jgi:Subtilase family